MHDLLYADIRNNGHTDIANVTVKFGEDSEIQTHQVKQTKCYHYILKNSDAQKLLLQS